MELPWAVHNSDGKRPQAQPTGLCYWLRMPLKKMLRKFVMTSSWVALG
jgi:hypothetical protein